MTDQPSSTQQNQEPPLANAVSFIETQFPVSKISIESYKERKAVSGQTLTGLGKWWGRKPLILVRAALLGLLMPASENPEKDREIFLKLLTMDAEGLRIRKNSNIPISQLEVDLKQLPPSVQKRFLTEAGKIRKDLDRNQKQDLQALIFDRLPYSEKIGYCFRPEQIEGPNQESWQEINNHLDTSASCLEELIKELGIKRFGHFPKVGDAFCGGGSIPFEAARLGCDVFGSDLNPVAALLTWASLNLIGGGEKVANEVHKSQQELFQEVDKQITQWGIEHNSLGWRADAYLYCVEVVDPESCWRIPLLPTLAIAPKTKVIAKLVPDEENKRFDIQIVEGVDEKEYKLAEEAGTIKDSRLVSPLTNTSVPIEVIRKDLRMWEKNEFYPRPDDIFQERLYCIRWVETNSEGRTIRHYKSPTLEDLQREKKVIDLVGERFFEWQENGYIPSRKIEPGPKTDEPIRTRGWTYWHHLFTPRQLLNNGLFAARVKSSSQPISSLLLLGKIANNNSKLSRWSPDQSGGIGKVVDVFSNQALNTFYNYGNRTLLTLNSLLISFNSVNIFSYDFKIVPQDARNITNYCDLWITDPPYADAVNYEEITEFFIVWYDKLINNYFPAWYVDSKRAMAVKGNDTNFRVSMVNCYKKLSSLMPNNGIQIVMFTHQDASVWADLSMILWASGLRVTAAWTITTERDSALKKGNYVQGTVLMVLRKRLNTESLFLDELNFQVEKEVRNQLDIMTKLEDSSDPNFSDSDYQLAAYAAALRVLTAQPIEDIDPEKEIIKDRKPDEDNPIEKLIKRAVRIACDHLIPKGLSPELWKSLNSMERFYIKGLEVESHGEYRNGVYQELARGFGATSYTDLLANTRANETRLKNASEFGRSMVGKFEESQSFGDSLVRICLFAIWQTTKNEDTKDGLNFLHTELKDFYWVNRERILGLLEYFSNLRYASSMEQWKKDAHAASLLAGAVRNDHV